MACAVHSQTFSSEQLLAKSIQYHDPGGKWDQFKGTLHFDQINPTRVSQSTRTVSIDRSLDLFRFEQELNGTHITREFNNGQCINMINGSASFSEEDEKNHRLTCERAEMYRDYYTYLYGLPMKLRDPGTFIDPVVQEDSFRGKPCYSIRVKYDPEVGKDTWDFFFDRNSFALIGYRFYHDVSANDGEYITLHGEEVIGGIRIPKNRYWYMNKDDRYLGADILLPANGTAARDIGEDYQRAVSLQWNSIINKKVFNMGVRPQWFPDSSGLWFNLFDAQGKWYHRINFDDMQQQELFDHDIVAEKLSELKKDTIKANALPIRNLTFISKDTFTFDIDVRKYQLVLPQHSINEIEKPKSLDPYSSTSPDGKWKAYSKDYNLYIKNIESGTETQISEDGSEHFQYASFLGWFDLMEGEGGARPKQFYIDWSPDSKYLLTSICDTRTAEKMYMLDWSVDTLFKPRLLSYYRGSPGDTTMVHYIPFIYNTQSHSIVPHNLPRNTHINSVGTKWSKDEDILYARIPHRGYQKEELIKINLKDGIHNRIIEEVSATNIDDMRFWYREEAGKIFFTSQRTGWRQLYAYDLIEDKIHVVTEGDFFFRDIKHMDDDARILFFTASGREDGHQPYQQQLYTVGYDGGEIKRMTSENVNHAVEFSPDGKYYWDNASTVTYPTRT